MEEASPTRMLRLSKAAYSACIGTAPIDTVGSMRTLRIPSVRSGMRSRHSLRYAAMAVLAGR